MARKPSQNDMLQMPEDTETRTARVTIEYEYLIPLSLSPDRHDKEALVPKCPFRLEECARRKAELA